MSRFDRLSGFAFALVLCAATPAAAFLLPEVAVVQETTLSAASCQPTSASANLRIYSAPRLRNQGSSSQGVVCPVAFDASKSQISARVQVSGNVSASRCRFSVRHQSGSTSYGPWAYGSSAGSISVANRSVPSTSSVNLECLVPAAQTSCSRISCQTVYSEIKAIRISEYE